MAVQRNEPIAKATYFTVHNLMKRNEEVKLFPAPQLAKLKIKI